MTVFRTCHTCVLPAATCAARAALQVAIAGLGITSVKHRCATYAPAFAPGDAVKVLTLPYYPTDDEPVSVQRWFPGHFIRLSGTRALVFVKKGALSLDRNHQGCDVEFEPNGNGHLKVPLSRIAQRDGAPADVRQCGECGAEPGLGEKCQRDPVYGRVSRCLAAILSAESGLGDGTGGDPSPRKAARDDQ